MTRGTWAAALLLSAVCLRAQTTPPPAPVSPAAPAPDSALGRCIGQRITRISIETMGPEFGGKSASSRVITSTVRKFHVDSRARLIREFVQLKEGGICTEIARRETERVLRAQWFIQDARVLVFPDQDGVQLIVTTVDEVGMIAGAGVSGTELRSLTFGNSNLLGRGWLVEVGWRDNGALRDSRSVRLRSAVTFGRPIQTNLTWNKYGLGNRTMLEMRAPFLTDLQRYGFRALLGRDEDYVRFVRPSGDLPLQRVARKYASIGGVARIGRPGALLLSGLNLSYDDENIGGAVIRTDSGSTPFGEPLPVLPAPPQEATRLNLVFGGRAMRFLPVEGFDALTGVQDLRLGVQFGGQIGRPLKLSGISNSDFFVSSDFYAGWGTPKWYAGTEWISSGRKSSAGWDGRLTSGRLAAYLKPAKRSTSIVSVEYAGGRDVRVPFQIPLSGTRTGMLTYRDGLVGGQSRAIIRAEQRQVVGRPWGFADVGLAGFTEIGRVWAGRVPYGLTTPWRSAVGAGLLMSVPPRSRQTFRFDVAYGLNDDGRSNRWEFRVTSGNFTRVFWNDPDETRLARERSLVTNLFQF